MKRYPGIRPFTAEDQHLFYGRDDEQRDLFQMTILNDVVVLFGKSGTGKSSLLNAGVCPQFEDRNLHPIFIRLNNTTFRPEQQVYEFLREHDYIPKDMPEGLTLWEYFKRFWYVNLGEVFTPVIIFDQFEELFTLYTQEERQNFINEFADLVNGRMPGSLQQKIKDPSIDLDKKIDWQTPPKVKFLLSIRSDYLYLLNELSVHIPSILRTRFQLNMLNRSNAVQAITLPAIATGQYKSPSFEYEQQSLEEIIEVLGKKERDQFRADLTDTETEIEAFQLQLFCQQIENRIISENKPLGFKVNPQFFGGKEGIQKIIGDFYSDVVNRVPREYQVAVETMAATYLIRNKRRIIMEESAIRDECSIPQELLDQLHEERLLRKEARTGHFYYEISHDTLIEPILEKYQDIALRLEKERQEKEWRTKEMELAAIKQKAEEERQRAEEQAALRQIAESNERKAKRITWIALFISILGLALAIFAGIQYRNASLYADKEKAAREDADRNYELAKLNEKRALDNQSQAEKEKLNALKSAQEAVKAKEQADQNLKLANENAKRANENAVRAREEQQKAEKSALAEKVAKEEASANLLLAEENERQARLAKNQAENERQKAESTLTDLQNANKATVELLHREIDQNIFQLDYDGASEKTKAALLLKAEEAGSLQRLQEIAFFYTESGQYAEAKEILSSVEIDANEDLISLRKLITEIDATHYDAVEQQYYPEMILVPGGRYKLEKDDQTRVNAIQADSFWLAKTETTVWQYKLYAQATNRKLPEAPSWGWEGNNPIMGLSWFDAIAYTNWVSEQKGYPKAYKLETEIKNPNDLFDKNIDWTKVVNWEAGGYRLPTEEEWEYAANGGETISKTLRYAGSNDLNEVGWSVNNSNGRPQKVASKNHNQFGIYDMSGNVWEWCWDWYEDAENDATRVSKKKNDPIMRVSRVLRGGSWFLGDNYCRINYRGKSIPNLKGNNYGFRCARSRK